MGNIVISVEHLSKKYNLGVIGTGTFSRDLNKWWARFRGKPDPYARIGEADHGNRNGDSVLALDDVSFSVEQGEVLGIIGRNGAGKSTLLKILSQVTAPTDGKIKIKGRIGSLLEVGTGFHPELTGRENVYLNGAILGMNRREVDSKFDEIVDFSGVEKYIDTPVKRYSSGMHVRLAFAVAAHLEPEILIVDEVLAVGDAEFQKKCLGKMGDVAHEGRTVLFVSHNMAAVRVLCQRAICLEAGKITFKGDQQSGISHYLEKNINNVGEYKWESIDDAPGNRFSKIHCVRIRNQKHDIVNHVFTNEEFAIEIEYWNLINNCKLSITLLVFTEEGSILFSSLSNHEPKWHNKQRPVGLFISKCNIPANILSPGIYSIGVIICASNYQDCHRIDEIIRFKIVDSGDLRGDYFGGYSGIIRPFLSWRTELLENGRLISKENK